MASVIDEKVGHKIELTNPEQLVNDFAEALNRFERNWDLLKEMSLNCKDRQKELSWESKARQMIGLYKRILQK